MKAPFPYFGTKSTIAGAVWERLGADVKHYIEPFFGSGAVLLQRPGWSSAARWIETVNDKDGFIANVWRAIAAAPDEVARWSDWPINEVDLHARHAWLVEQTDELAERLLGDPEYYDAKIAGWWLWGASVWIGGGWCSGKGSWVREDGRLVQSPGDRGVPRRRVHLSSHQGVQRHLVHLTGRQGVQTAGDGDGILAWMRELSARLRHVRVCNGDWRRVVTDGVIGPYRGITAVFLDPPYSADAGRDMGVYSHDSGSVAHAVREWCLERGARRDLRIALCGYRGEGHESLEAAGWSRLDWSSGGGYANQGDGSNRNRHREAIWFSPHCLSGTARRLPGFDE